ncbi:hypothetical protein DIPPA_04121 [Diplonema papillatum]|nr:hypothetical protein DIPPA_04121 [Diplonema papillatum]
MDALRDAHVKRLGSAFQQAPAGKAFPAKCAELAKNVVEALLDAHPAEGTRMGDAFKLQFKALLANAKSVYDHLEAGSTPHEVAVMAPKQMASAAVQRKNREILEEEIEYATPAAPIQNVIDSLQ